MITNKGVFIFQMFAVITGIVIIFFGVGALDLLPFSFQMQLLLSLVLFIQFTFGVLMMAPVIKVKNEYLAIRFLAITALQICSFLAICLVFTFSGIANGKEIMLVYLVLFLILMTLQSILLIRAINK